MYFNTMASNEKITILSVQEKVNNLARIHDTQSELRGDISN